MARDIYKKCKKCRRLGEKLFLKGERCLSAKCAFVKRNYPPGLHGSKSKKFSTNYGQQLKEKQKAKQIYGILEKQFKNYYLKAIKKRGNTSEGLLQFLEMRLDNVVYRIGLANSRKQSRQLVNHGLISVNGKKVTIPSYQLKPKDIVSIKSGKENKKAFNNIAKNTEQREIPIWIDYNAKELKAKIVNLPKLEDFKVNFNTTLIVEFYSR